MHKSSSNLSNKAFLNAVSQIIDYAARMVVTLIVTPILVTGLGSSVFGIWQVLIRSIGIISVADGRPVQALKWVISSLQGQDDKDVKRRSVGSAFIVWLFFLPVLILFGGIFIWASPFITGVGENSAPLVRTAAAFLVLNLLLSGFIGVPEAVLRGSNLGYKRMGVVALLTCLEGALMAGVIFSNHGLPWLAAVKVVISIATGVLFLRITKKSVCWFGWSKPRRDEIRTFFVFNGWFLGESIVNRIINSIDVILLGTILATTKVTIYSLTGYAPQMAFGIILILTGSVMPGLGGLIGLKEDQRVLQLRDELNAYTWLIATVSCAVILIWNHSFIELWVGNNQYAGHHVNFLLVILMMQKVFIQNNSRIIDLTLDLRKKVLIGAASLILTVITSLALVYKLGIAGVCFGFIVGQSLQTFFYSAFLDKYFEIPFLNNIIKRTRQISTAIIIFLFSYHFGKRSLVNDWIEFVGFTIFSTIAIFVITFFCGNSFSQRKKLISRFGALYSNIKFRV